MHLLLESPKNEDPRPNPGPATPFSRSFPAPTPAPPLRTNSISLALERKLAATSVEISAVPQNRRQSKNGRTFPLRQEPEGGPAARNAKDGRKTSRTFSQRKEVGRGAKGTVRYPHTIKSLACSRKGRIPMGGECSLARPNPNPDWDLLTFGMSGQGFSVVPPPLPCRHPGGCFP